jgi:hypothetical protein
LGGLVNVRVPLLLCIPTRNECAARSAVSTQQCRSLYRLLVDSFRRCQHHWQ